MKAILPGVWTFTGLPVGRVYLLEDADGLTLVDAGLTLAAERILRQLAAAGRRPDEVRRILVTHGHFDHVGGLPRLKAQTGAQVIASDAERPILEGQQPLQYPPVETLPLRARLMRAGSRGDSFLKGITVDRTVEDGEMLPEVLGGLQALIMPGHTPGHTVYWHPERRLLFCGDAIMHFTGLSGPFRAVSTDMDDVHESIARIAALQPAAVCFGHGNPLLADTAARITAFARSCKAIQ